MDSLKSVVINSMTVKRTQHRIKQRLAWLQQADIEAMLRQAFFSIVLITVTGTKRMSSQFARHSSAKYAMGIHLTTTLQGTNIYYHRTYGKTQRIARQLNDLFATVTQAAGVLRLTMVATGDVTA